MKHFFTLLFIFSSFSFIQGQSCLDLFFSEYVEGWSNNKALEIYNPTADSIDLSAYSISRYTNGDVQASTPQQLEGIIAPHDVFVIGLDKRDPNGTGYDAPMWDGYYTYTDSITGEEVTTYDIDSDLQGKIDFWANGIYYSGTDPDSAAIYPMTMFFNGNDALTLERIGIGIVDLIGKVGEDPGAAWSDAQGNYWTKDHTLMRKSSITSGVVTNPLVFDPTMEWDSLPANTFENLGFHNCDCNDNTNLLESASSITIYPNPSSTNTIKINSLSMINAIRIYNKLGQMLIDRKINHLTEAEITLPDEKDIYFISIKTTHGIKTKRVIFH